MKAWFIACLLLFPLIGVSQEIDHAHSLFHGMTENKGQWDNQVLFQSRSQKHTIWVQQHGFIFDIRDYSVLQKAHANPDNGLENTDYTQTIVAAHFVGSQTVTSIEKHKPGTHYYNYFLGNNQHKWATAAYSYNEAVLKDFYAGVDLKVFDDETKFKYELWCQPNSAVNSIAIDYKGAKQLKLDEKGNLIVSTPLGDLIEQAPIAYQIYNGKISPVKCAFKLTGNRVSFDLGSYNKSAVLVIDPTLVFATYCGSVTDNFGMTATYGYDGTAYSAGTVYGNSYPTPDNSAYDVTSNFTVVNVANSVTTDAFLSKYSPDGSTMIWTTFIGGGDNTQGTETAHSLICDKLNNVYMYGVTSSIDFPIVNGYQPNHGGGTPLSVNFNGSNFGTTGTDIYVAKFSANGQNLMGSTYMGGSLNDGVNFKVSSGNYSSVAAYDSLTTNYGDQFRGEIMIDSVGDCMIASCSRSADFPISNAFQPVIGGQQDGVIFKLSSDLSTLQWSSFFGGSNNDACYSVKIDSSYNIVFAGGTSSNNLPGTAGAVNPNYMGGKTDGFVAKLTPDLTAVQNSTIFGNGNGAINISPSAFLVDICGNMYISGWGANILQGTPLSGMPISANAFQSTAPNGFDFYLAVLDRDFDGLLYGSYLGGNTAQEHVDGGTSRFDKNGVVYQSVCGGCGGNSDFPTTTNAWSNTNLSSNGNNLVFKFDFELIPEAEFFTDDLLGCASYEVTLQNTSPPRSEEHTSELQSH